MTRPGGEVEVHFPGGETWHDLATGERIKGGQTRLVRRTLEDLPAWGRDGHVLCLGRAVQHTGEIDPACPVEEVRVFGIPAHSPCVMGGVVTVGSGPQGTWLRGVRLDQCVPSSGLALREGGEGRILVEWAR